ncbi:aromatic amino acid transaminase [Parahaliea mediterranea]|uniref:Aspartate/tyrosine/aromatic aminotransferase n=1 Tax=Parahaliea mediterranea TaxID=651086 RepID=A0A939IKB5_9GAMM|nr:amino acid aminotransferase [Parahaliea mediterranea]MBN7795285.1 aspartate/tyrosine/aromatic aminotransferase [Parahaliea mediterranea]
MLENLEVLPPDPLLGLMAAFAQDPNPQKIDLGVGIYQDNTGQTPVMGAVLEAEARLLASEGSKRYLPPAGDPAFTSGMLALVLGEGAAGQFGERVRVVQTPGGCGALRIGAEVIARSRPGARVWVSDPTWPNHVPLLGGAGLQLQTYPYYDFAHHRLDFDAMFAALGEATAGDVVLLHGCCHNPSGADLSLQQWQVLTELCEQKGFTPMVDVAYQGLGQGLEADAAGWRWMAERVPEILIASSCSKNFGLYRERTGALLAVARDGRAAQAVHSQALSAARQIYSMPPSHGALAAGMILQDADLGDTWRHELAQMRERIASVRRGVAQSLGSDFQFIVREAGMFSFLGIRAEQVKRLREEFGIYMAESTRINLAGLNDGNLEYFCTAMNTVLNERH